MVRGGEKFAQSQQNRERSSGIQSKLRGIKFILAGKMRWGTSLNKGYPPLPFGIRGKNIL